VHDEHLSLDLIPTIHGLNPSFEFDLGATSNQILELAGSSRDRWIGRRIGAPIRARQLS
jgi:hypothetical protein